MCVVVSVVLCGNALPEGVLYKSEVVNGVLYAALLVVLCASTVSPAGLCMLHAPWK